MVSLASSLVWPPLSSVTVRVSFTSPLSLQVTVGSSAVVLLNTHVALGSMLTPTYCQDQLNLSLVPASVAEPSSWIGEPSSPEYPVVPPPASATGSTFLTVSVAVAPVLVTPSSSVAVSVRVKGFAFELSVQVTLASLLV